MLTTITYQFIKMAKSCSVLRKANTISQVKSIIQYFIETSIQKYSFKSQVVGNGLLSAKLMSGS